MKVKSMKIICAVAVGLVVVGGIGAIAGGIITDGFKNPVASSVDLLSCNFSDVSIREDTKAHRIEVGNLPLDSSVVYYDYMEDKDVKKDETIDSTWTLRDYATWTGETTAGTYKFKAVVSLKGSTRTMKAEMKIVKAE